jgi:hypothetical protein
VVYKDLGLLQGASDEFADANISLALVMARKLKEMTGRDAKLVRSRGHFVQCTSGCETPWKETVSTSVLPVFVSPLRPAADP